MAKTVDLMAFGMPAAQANCIGMDPVAVTCAGTTAGAATLIQYDVVNLTAASSQTGAILPAVGTNPVPSLGMMIIASNTSSTTAVVYPPTGAAFNLSGSTSISIAQYKTVLFIYYSPTLIFTILTA